MKFLDVKTDFAFKKVFGSEGSKAILLSFLNAFDFFDGQQVIVDLSILDPYQAPKIMGMKGNYVDVNANLDNGTSVIIEIQILNMPGLEQPILFNAVKAHSAPLREGESRHLRDPVIALTITDFVMFNDGTAYKSAFRLLEKEQLAQHGGDIELVFIELPKFSKTEAELNSSIDHWLYFIKNAGSLSSVPADLGASSELTCAFEIANYAGLSPEDAEAQHRRLDFIWLMRDSIARARQQGYEQGLTQAREERKRKGVIQGREQAQFDIALRLLAAGMTPQQAADMTDIAVERLS